MKKNFLIKTLLKTYGINKNQILNNYKRNGVNQRNHNYDFKNQRVANKLQNFFNNSKINFFGKVLKNIVKKTIHFEENIKTFRGLRNKYGYPCRGQRTHTNGKSKKKFKNL